MTTRHTPVFDHLETMTDGRGLFEHADGTRRRVEHGYCTDDNARLLVVTAREDDVGAACTLSRVALTFTLSAQVPDGRSHNRMNASGRWTDRPTTDDCWGRTLWGLGVAATQHDDIAVSALAMAGFDLGIRQRSRWPRAMAFATLGAVDVVAENPDHHRARALIEDALVVIGHPARQSWVWPERRLSYANATLAEATIAAGFELDDDQVLARGLAMLRWLLDVETKAGHLSVTGVGGRERTDDQPQFDQQPIEVAAMADACWRAHKVTGDGEWLNGVRLAAAWFEGANDTGASMRDHGSGGGFDGLLVDGVNLNQGAESTLALISTMQRARDLDRRSALT